VLAAVVAAACGGREEPYLTYFSPEHALTLRYPSSWKAEQAQQDGVWYRYFLAPPTGPERKPAVSVTLIAGPLGVSLDQYAQTYLAGNIVRSSRDEARPGAKGKFYLFASPDGKMRQSLLLLEESAAARVGLPATPTPRPSASASSVASPSAATSAKTSVAVRPSPTPIPTPTAPASAPSAWVYGLYAQGEATAFESQLPVLEEMAKSLALERPALYPEERNRELAFSLRMPASWRSTRTFSGGGTFVKQYTSPPFGAEKQQTVHASLTLTVEPAPGDGSAESYQKATMDKLGEAFVVLTHAPWRDGYMDVLHSETPVAVSRSKRYYRTARGRGYSLALEARDDIYPRVWRWCDMIAATLEVGPEVTGP
jgi:hypothetical protein